MKNITIIFLFFIFSCKEQSNVDKNQNNITDIKDNIMVNQSKKEICFSKFDFFNPNFLNDTNYINSNICLFLFNEIKGELSNSLNSLKYKVSKENNLTIFRNVQNIENDLYEVSIIPMDTVVFKIKAIHYNKIDKKKSFVNSVEIINKNGFCEKYQFSEEGLIMSDLSNLLNEIKIIQLTKFEKLGNCESHLKYNVFFKKNNLELKGEIELIDYEQEGKIIKRPYIESFKTNSEFNLVQWIYFGHNLASE